MFDGGSGSLRDAIESLYNSYEVICLMEGIANPLSKDRLDNVLQAGYGHHIRSRRSQAMKFINGEVDNLEYVTKCILHNKGDTPFLWLEFHSMPDGGVTFYIVRETEEDKND